MDFQTFSVFLKAVAERALRRGLLQPSLLSPSLPGGVFVRLALPMLSWDLLPPSRRGDALIPSLLVILDNVILYQPL